MLQDFITTLRSSLSSADTIRNAILAFVLLLLVALAVGGTIYFMRLSSPKGRLDELLKERAEGEFSYRWPYRLLVLPLIVLAFVGASSYMSRETGCGQCHGREMIKTLASSPHKGIACMSCHSSQGFTAPLRQAVTYSRWLYAYSESRKPPKLEGSDVDERACLGCHGVVRRATVARNGIKVRHSDFLNNGSRCAECHSATAHGDSVVQATRPSMSGCLICHNGQTASSDCVTCHVQDPLEKVPEGRGFAKVQLDTSKQKQTCFRCHDPAPCYRCHGLQMPHPEGWTRTSTGPNKHARIAFETNRQVCWRCHFKGNKVFEPDHEACKPCHNPGLALRIHGGAGWLKEHGPEAVGQKPGVFAACFDCHIQTLCDDCHPASYRERYKPVTGYDSYTREVPLDPELVP